MSATLYTDNVSGGSMKNHCAVSADRTIERIAGHNPPNQAAAATAGKKKMKGRLV